MYEVCVDGWRRAFDGVKEFISFRISLKHTEGGSDSIRIEKRYSEFNKFHSEIKCLFVGRERNQLEESFPSKQPLSLQTDLFAERRAKALDAYLQILFHLLTNERKVHEIVREFFNIPKEKIVNKNVKRESVDLVLRTPNGLNSEIDRLRSETAKQSDFESVHCHVRQLQEKRQISAEEKRCIDKFYEIKREWEMKQIRIRSGQFDIGSFELKKKNSDEVNEQSNMQVIEQSNEQVNKKSNYNFAHDERTVESLQHHIRDQDAILNELAATVHEQRLLSKEICAEVAEQNKIIENVARKQEGTMEGFKESSGRVRKLQ